MKPTITEISVSYSGKIALPHFNNRDPFFGIKETYPGALTDEFINQRHEELQQMCVKKFIEAQKLLTAPADTTTKPKTKFEPIPKGHRIYICDGKKYPSVTTIIGDNVKFFVPDEHLKQLAARGTIIHKLCEIYVTEGIWKKPEDVPEIANELKIVSEGDSKLDMSGYNFPGFRAKFPFQLISCETKVKNNDMMYAGTQDLKVTVNGVVTLYDVKSGKPPKEQTFMQLAAYAKCHGNEDVAQLGIIYLGGNKQGFSTPVMTTEIDKYFNMFRIERETYKNKYGI
jgi:hypothetical protein